jgi:hypothetical protein
MRTGDQIVQDLPWRWNVQGKIFLIGGLGYMFDAWDVALNGFLTPLVGADFGLTARQKGLVATANLIGMAVGAVAWGTGTVPRSAPLCVKRLLTERKPNLLDLGVDDRGLQPWSSRLRLGSLGKHLSPWRLTVDRHASRPRPSRQEWLERGLQCLKLVCPPCRTICRPTG